MIYGDGGQSGFSTTNSALRFNSFTSRFHDLNFQNGDPLKWVIGSAPIVLSGEGAQFYAPIIADPSPAAGQTFLKVRRASGGLRTGAAIKHSWKLTAPSSPLPARRMDAAISSRLGLPAQQT